MNFSRYQWLLGFILDFLLKAGCLFLVGALAGIAPVSVLVWIALGFSIFHFLSLSLASGFVGLFNLTGAAKFGLAVIVANILFVGSNVSLWTWSINGTACTGIDGKCDWINGAITPSGVQTIAAITLILFVMNLIPILISAAFGWLASRN